MMGMNITLVMMKCDAGDDEGGENSDSRFGSGFLKMAASVKKQRVSLCFQLGRKKEEGRKKKEEGRRTKDTC